MKKYFDICVMALGVFLYFPFIYYGESSSIPSIFFAFFFPLFIYFLLRPAENYYQYYWGRRGGNLRQNICRAILMQSIFSI